MVFKIPCRCCKFERFFFLKAQFQFRLEWVILWICSTYYCKEAQPNSQYWSLHIAFVYIVYKLPKEELGHVTDLICKTKASIRPCLICKKWTLYYTNKSFIKNVECWLLYTNKYYIHVRRNKIWLLHTTFVFSVSKTFLISYKFRFD